MSIDIELMRRARKKFVAAGIVLGALSLLPACVRAEGA